MKVTQDKESQHTNCAYKQTNKHTNKRTNKHTNKQMNIQAYKHTNKRTNKHTNKRTYKHTNKQTNKQTDEQTKEQTRRTDKQMDTRQLKRKTFRAHTTFFVLIFYLRKIVTIRITKKQKQSIENFKFEYKEIGTRLQNSQLPKLRKVK